MSQNTSMCQLFQLSDSSLFLQLDPNIACAFLKVLSLSLSLRDTNGHACTHVRALVD